MGDISDPVVFRCPRDWWQRATSARKSPHFQSFHVVRVAAAAILGRLYTLRIYALDQSRVPGAPVRAPQFRGAGPGCSQSLLRHAVEAPDTGGGHQNCNDRAAYCVW